jgi:hypothetical protein
MAALHPRRHAPSATASATKRHGAPSGGEPQTKANGRNGKERKRAEHAEHRSLYLTDGFGQWWWI